MHFRLPNLPAKNYIDYRLSLARALFAYCRQIIESVMRFTLAGGTLVLEPLFHICIYEVVLFAHKNFLHYTPASDPCFCHRF